MQSPMIKILYIEVVSREDAGDLPALGQRIYYALDLLGADVKMRR